MTEEQQQKTKTPHWLYKVAENTEQLEVWYIAMNWYKHFGKLFGNIF